MTSIIIVSISVHQPNIPCFVSYIAGKLGIMRLEYIKCNAKLSVHETSGSCNQLV